MRATRRGVPGLLGSVLLLSAQASWSGELRAGGVPEGRWRVSRGIVAPWVEDGSSIDPRAWIGNHFEFGAARFSAPSGLSCDSPRYETDQREAAGLFQGNMQWEPESPAKAATALALTRAATPSITLTCDTGIFDLHWATPQALMLAVDNVIWVLDRSPGALADADAPEAQVQRFLEAHFADEMRFDPATVAANKNFFSASLQQRIAGYFAQSFPNDEPPPINGDPFTNTQDYPVLFSVGAAEAGADATGVLVRFDDGY